MCPQSIIETEEQCMKFVQREWCLFQFKFIRMNALFKLIVLADIQKEKRILQCQMNITLSYYLKNNQTKKLTITNISIMYNKCVLRNKSEHYQKHIQNHATHPKWCFL